LKGGVEGREEEGVFFSLSLFSHPYHILQGQKIYKSMKEWWRIQGKIISFLFVSLYIYSFIILIYHTLMI
jgi:hypothetical protein